MTSSLRRGQGGFTLVEMLVAVSVGMIVVLAAFSILDLGVKQSAKVADRQDTVQRARVAMYTIASQLRARVCLSAAQPSIYYGDPYKVQFYGSTGTSVDPTLAPTFRPVLHEISWDTNSNTIVEKDWASGVLPPALPATTRTLLTNVVPPPGNAPIFGYYGFLTSPVDGSVTADQALSTPPSPLPNASAPDVIRVSISFTTQPTRAGAGYSSSALSTTLQEDAVVRTADPSADGGPTRTRQVCEK